jgi:ribosomal protein S18 acetylase RimI-like enzyme
MHTLSLLQEKYIAKMAENKYSIKPVTTAADLDATIQLFKAYTLSLNIDLTFQDFATELSSMPGKYSPPAGSLLLARSTTTGEPLGCIGIRPITSKSVCEMKRLYVAPQGRGLGLGKTLIDAAIKEAVRIGYARMRLDTLPTMGTAIDLYRKNGFVQIDAYYETPITATMFFERILAS